MAEDFLAFTLLYQRSLRKEREPTGEIDSRNETTMSDHETTAPPDAYEGSPVSLETLLTASPYLYCALDGDGTIRKLNAAAEAVLGYSEDELTGHNLLTLLHSEDRPRVSRAMSDAREAAEGPLMLRVESAPGHLRTLSVWFSRDPDSELIISWGSDVTESRAIREELRMRIELLEDLLAQRTRSMAELQTRLEDLRWNPTGEASREGPRRSSRPASPPMSGSIRPRRTPSSGRERGGSWLRSGSPPRMTMGRYHPTSLPLPDSPSDPDPHPEMRPPP